MPNGQKQAKNMASGSRPDVGEFFLNRLVVTSRFLLLMALGAGAASMPALAQTAAQSAGQIVARQATDAMQREFREAIALYQAGRFADALAIASKLAEQGHAEAQAMMGVLYERGQGVEANPAKAAEWFRKAAQQGHTGAMFALAMLYLEGRLGKKDREKAQHWLLEAARRGMKEAQYNLALLYADASEGHKPDWQQAARWFRRAAEQGYALAQYNLGVLYLSGKGVERNFMEASEWFKRAALGGLPQGATEYGLLVLRGDGVRKNEPIGARWLAYAARSGYAPAMQKLARLYAIGRGVSKDVVEAAKWYLLARERGMRDAWLDLFMKHLPEKVLKQARERARAFRPTRLRPINMTTSGKGGMQAARNSHRARQGDGKKPAAGQEAAPKR